MKPTNRAAVPVKPTRESPSSAWLQQRVGTTILLALLALNLISIHFFIPDGLAGLTPNLLITRWSDPMGGLAWRWFDWLLVGLGVLNVNELITGKQQAGGKSGRFQKWLKSLVLIAGSAIMIVSAQVIFGPAA